MQMTRAKCKACGWVYDVVALPMPLETAAAVMMAARCSMCGNAQGNTVAPSRDLTDIERLGKMHALARTDAPGGPPLAAESEGASKEPS